VDTAPTLDHETIALTEAGLRSWLRSGAAQTPAGAFVAWLEPATGAKAFEYPEITGYALTYLAGLADIGAPAGDLASAVAAAHWLVTRLDAGNLAAREGWDQNAEYLFDLGIIATGLLMLGDRISSDRYLAAGLRLVSRLRTELAGNGISALTRAGPRSTRNSWSTVGTAHLAKLVQCFLLAADQTMPDVRAIPERLIEAVKRIQGHNGRIPTHPEHAVMLHPHLYAAEGLWIWGTASGDADAVERARVALAWTWEHQLETGGLPRSETIDTEQTDVTTQAVRLSLALNERGPALDRALIRITELARKTPGGLALVYRPNPGNEHLNTWATLFGAQALALAAPRAPALSWRTIV
jgi:hypothetical protein